MFVSSKKGHDLHVVYLVESVCTYYISDREREGAKHLLLNSVNFIQGEIPLSSSSAVPSITFFASC